MILKVFSVLDVKADAFLSPFFFSTTGQAVRAFKDLVNDHQSTLHRHPADYRLFHVGTFDDSNAFLTALEKPEPLGYASDYKDLPATPVGVSHIKVAP